MQKVVKGKKSILYPFDGFGRAESAVFLNTDATTDVSSVRQPLKYLLDEYCYFFVIVV